MLGVFFLIFRIAHIPMDLIDALFANLGSWIGQHMPAGDLRSLLVKGVIGGLGGMLVFLPQICILFFCLSLLEDTGYLARAAFVMDRLMRHVGLPGKAFVPLLSAHACAIPAIMATPGHRRQTGPVDNDSRSAARDLLGADSGVQHACGIAIRA